MARVDTLTAYRCKLVYLRRNNPLLEEQREAIQKGETPTYTFACFLADYSDYAKNVVVGESADRAILLQEESVSSSTKDVLTKWHVRPKVGKQGKPVTVIKKSGRKYDFGADTAALYQHHVFAYDNGDSVIMIFHRQSGSGCKGVFLETANNCLKNRGLKLEMELILPLEENTTGATPTKLILQATRQIVSSDVADNINTEKQKTVVIKELALNLSVEDHNVILNTIKQMQLGAITKEAALATIKAEVDEASDEYNKAEVSLKIGKKTRKVQLEEIERLLGAYDITDRLRNGTETAQGFIQRLEQLSDEYYEKIVNPEGV